MCACPVAAAVSLALTTNQTGEEIHFDGLELVKCVFRGWNQIRSDVYSCLFHVLSTYKKNMIGSHFITMYAENMSVVWVALFVGDSNSN